MLKVGFCFGFIMLKKGAVLIFIDHWDQEHNFDRYLSAVISFVHLSMKS